MATRIIRNPLQWGEVIADKRRAIAMAAAGALRQTANDVVKEGRRNIAASGRFGPKWQKGLQARFKGIERGQASPDAKAIIFHRFGIAGVFEHGATIQGKPLLWIPTTPGGRPASRSGKKLVSATVGGRPMLFDADDRDRHRKPLYIGVPSVRIPKKWNILAIAKAHAAKLKAVFLKYLKD